MRHIKLWLDDVRDPADFGHIGWHWVRTAEEAIAWLNALDTIVDEASLDHDLSWEQTLGGVVSEIREDQQRSGYDVVCWLEEHSERWPDSGVHVHSANPAGRARMQSVIDRYNAEKKLNIVDGGIKI